MDSRPITIVSNMPDDVASYLGEPVCVGLRNRSTKLLTILIAASNFQGLVELDGALSIEPGPDDFFPVIAPLRYPRIPSSTPSPAYVVGSLDPLVPRAHGLGLPRATEPLIAAAALGETSTLALSLKLDLVWIRARITRGAPWLKRPELASSALSFGSIDQITCR